MAKKQLTIRDLTAALQRAAMAIEKLGVVAAIAATSFSGRRQVEQEAAKRQSKD